MNNVIELTQPGWTRICEVTQIFPNTGVCSLLGRDQVAVFRLGDADRVYALGNLDPFSGASVLSRGIVGDRGGTPKVASPVYKQSFCLRTGVCLDDPSVSVPVYEARVRAGIIEIRATAARTLRSGNTEMLGVESARG